MTSVKISKSVDAIVTGRNGAFVLQGIQFNVVPVEGATIEFVGDRGRVLNAGAYGIPLTTLVQLCIAFLEEQNYRVLNQFESQPDSVEFVNDDTGESYKNEDEAIECVGEGERIMRVEQFWTQIHPAEDEEKEN